ncbi:ATP-binding protein [Kitasatospora terrestris]|uniref:AAA+ ATPase domain-containing protein n=1 Tax=Kitasatospora terrestris TaxID=258051 RepID=A0ABP9E7I1_9ACTN
MARKTATIDEQPAATGGPDLLPATVAPFGGRGTELAALAQAAARPGKGRGRIVVLAGRPGSGRTSLAVRYARSVAADYPDGLLYARLSAPDGTRVEAGRAARLLLEQLGGAVEALLPGGTGDDPACEALRAELGGRRALLLLDDVRDAAQVGPLLAEKTESLVLATTFGPLTGIEGIDPVILGGLDQSVAVRLLGELVGGTRISCDPAGAGDLAEACAGRPAALRMMAGWLRANPQAAVTDAAKALHPPTEEDATARPRARGGQWFGGRSGKGGKAAEAGEERKGGRAGTEPPVPGGTAADAERAGSRHGGGGDGAAGGEGRASGARVDAAGGTASAGRTGGTRNGAGRDGAGRDGAARDGAPEVRREPREAEPVPVADSDPLKGAFELLYRRLPAARARMLRMLTLAPAQLADLRIASALVGCPAPEAGEALEQLAEQELLEREPAAADGTRRYWVPGRLYVRLVELREEQDRPSEVELARARMLERLVRLVDSARMLLDPAAGPNPDPLPGPLRLRTAAHAAGWLAEEREQLLAAVASAVGEGDLDGTAGRLVTALLRALPLTGAAAPADLYQLHESVLEVAMRQRAPRRAAAALLNLADLQAAAAHWERADGQYRQAVDRAREAGDEPGCARAMEGAGNAQRALADPVRAADWYGRALALRQGFGDRAGEARLLARLGEAHAAQRRFEEALREYRAAAGVLRRLGDARGEAAVTATLHRLQQRLDQEGKSLIQE